MTAATARTALQRLIEGNRRFKADVEQGATTRTVKKPGDLVAGQEPFAIILGCSDSRVPAEIIFDQGLGDLFVIRVAGNVVAPSQIGSVEFAVERFGTRLAVVLGHSNCGAVEATIQALGLPQETRSAHLASIVNRIRSAVEPLLETQTPATSDALMRQAVRANVRASANQLRHGSQLLEELVGSGQFRVVGAEYSLSTGLVEFFDGMEGFG